MTRNLFACIVGAVIAFAWSNISWMVLPWHSWSMQSFQEDGKAVQAAIHQEAKKSGIYFIPNISKDMHKNTEKQKEWVAKAKTGPYAYLTVKLEGTHHDMTAKLLLQFGILFIVAIFAVWLITQSTLQSPFARAIYVSIAVTSGAFISAASEWNWLGYPLTSTWVDIADVAVAWLLAGFFMGIFAKTKHA